MRRYRLHIVIAIFLVLLAIVLLLWKRGRGPGEQAAADPSKPGATSERQWKGPRAVRLPLPNEGLTAGAPPTPDPPPVIDEIKVEKTEVCEGEENLVSVKAHTVNNKDEYLHYVIDGEMGQSHPVKLYRNPDNGEVRGQHLVQVFGRGNVVTSVKLPEYKVKECRVERMVSLSTKVRPNSWAEFQFRAAVHRPYVIPPKGADRSWRPPTLAEFVPVKYVWSFGDGKTATTAEPIAEHNYEDRKQDTLYSYFLIQVEVHGKDGQVFSGRTSLPLINPAFEALYTKGKVQLMFAFTPRFPPPPVDGVVAQGVRIWHTRPQPVSIDRVRMTKMMGGESQTQMQDMSPDVLIGTRVIPPGPGITVEVKLDTNADPGIVAVTYLVEGTSDEGWPVTGTFSVMKPPDRPTADNSMPIADPMLKAKILRAREILKKDVVNDEDLWQLRRQGAFDDLEPADISQEEVDRAQRHDQQQQERGPKAPPGGK